MKSTPIVFKNCEVQEVDDILVTRFTGDYDVEHALKLQAITNELATRVGYRLLLIDVREMGAVTSGARRFLAQDQQRDPRPSSVAIVGATFGIRTIATMTIRAVGLLTKMPATLEFFDTEEQALAWLERERIRLRVMITSQAFA